MVALPLKSQSQIAIGEIQGDYEYKEYDSNIKHTRRVKWLGNILRSDLDDGLKKKVDHKFRRLFQDFRTEMVNKNNVNCELRVMNNKLSSVIHDRWIISGKTSFNLPSPDVIARGQFSEVKSTSNRPPFFKWWDNSLDIITDWNEIEKLKRNST